MALQLLNRPYAGLGGYECPKILKLPGNENRQTPAGPKIDVGDVMMRIRMDNGKNRFIQEHVSKYAQGLNPYGEFGEVYKIKVFRPPIIPPEQYEALSRRKVLSSDVTSGPIVSALYKKKTEINKISPKLIIDKVCPDTGTNPSLPIHTPKQCNYKDLQLKQPRASIPYHPSIPVYTNPQTGSIPTSEIKPGLFIRPNMGIHFPYNISDQSRDVLNMRTPSHIASASNLKIPGTTLDNEWMRQYPDLTPKVQTAAWYNPSYYLMPNSGYGISNVDTQKCIQDNVHVAGQTNVSWINQEAERGVTKLDDPLHAGSFEPKAYKTEIDPHPVYRNIRENLQVSDYNSRFVNETFDSNLNNNSYENAMRSRAIKDNLPKMHGELQEPRVDRTFLKVYK